MHTISLKIINHQLPSRGGRVPRQHSEDSSVHPSVPWWHSVEAFLASLQNNTIVSKMCMLSPSLKSEIGRESTAILSRTTKSLPSDAVWWESHGFRKRKKKKKKNQTRQKTASLHFRPLYPPSTHPSPSDIFHRVTWW